MKAEKLNPRINPAIPAAPKMPVVVMSPVIAFTSVLHVSVDLSLS